MADLRAVIPALVSGCNVRALPLGPVEGFVLSRIDGRSSAAEIALMTGLGDGVMAVLERLAELGAVSGVGNVTPPRTPAPAPPRTPAPPGPSTAPPDGKLDPSWSGPKVDDGGYTQAELDEPADLEIEKKRRILSVFHALARLDHYSLLGVARDADKKAIKAAYFKLAGEFHPDKHFRKNLGTFKPKMEAIFKRLTLAEEVLSRKEARAEYDASLEVRAQSLVELELFSREDFDAGVRAAAARPASPSPSPGDAGAPRAERASSAQVAAPPPPRPSSVAAPPPPRRSSEVPASSTPSVPDELGPATVRGGTRRSALVTKLSSGRFSPRTAAPLGADEPPVSDPEGAAETLRRMAAAKQASDRRDQLARYVTAAEEAAARDDAVAAANSYRFAAALDPTPELLERSTAWGQRAAVALAADYLRQGERAAAEGEWAEAARALVRAATGMPDDARVLSSAADALRRSSGDLHRAAELGRRATELAPTDVEVRLVLVEVYVAASLKLSARRELEAAAALAPEHAKIRALRAEVG